jgi:hypothetical protein
MDFGDERYVRLYTRDTATWKMLPEEGKCMLGILLRKADRAGVVEFGTADLIEAIVALTDMPRLREVVERGVEALATADVIVIHEGRLVFPRFIEAQETPQTDRARQRESRKRRADQARMANMSQNVTEPMSQNVTAGGASQNVTDPPSQNVTEPMSQNVTDVTERDGQKPSDDASGGNDEVPVPADVTGRHTLSHAVTPIRTDPIRAVPSGSGSGGDVTKRDRSDQPLALEQSHPDEEFTATIPDQEIDAYQPSKFLYEQAAASGMSADDVNSVLVHWRKNSRHRDGTQRQFDSRFKRYLTKTAKERAKGAAKDNGSQSKSSSDGWDGPLTKKLFGGDPRRARS